MTSDHQLQILNSIKNDLQMSTADVCRFSIKLFGVGLSEISSDQANDLIHYLCTEATAEERDDDEDGDNHLDIIDMNGDQVEEAYRKIFNT